MMAPVEPAAEGAARLPAWLRRLGYYGLALLFVAVAALLRWALSDVLRPTPFLVFYLAWVGAAAFGGFGPGLLATLASWFCVDLLFDTTPGQVGFTDPMAIGRLMVLLAGGLAVSIVGEKMRRSRIRERRQGRELGVANAQLQKQAEELIAQAEELQVANEELREREQALRESEERLHLALGAARMGAWQWEVGTEHVAWSPELYALLGYEPGRVTPSQRAFRQRIHPQDLARWEQALRESMERCEDYACEFRIVWGDGSVHWVEARGQYAYTRDESATETMWMRGVLSDIERRKQAEESLRETQERFHTMVNAIPQLAWIARADGYIYWYNQRWYEYTGTTPEAMEGWGWQSVHDPRELPQVLERWKSSIATGQPFDMTFPLRGADGVFRLFLTRVVPLKDEQGQVRQWFGTNTDVTEQKHAEEALRAKEAELELILTRTPFMLTRCSRDLHYRYVSRAYAEMIGRSPDQIAGKPILEIMGEEGFEAIRLHVETVLQGQPVEYEAPVHYRGVGSRFMRVTYVPDRDEQGHVIGWIASILDITERKQAEEALRASEAALAKAQALAHLASWEVDVRTNTVRGSNELYRLFNLEPDFTLDAYVEKFHPEDRLRVVESIQAAIHDEKPYSIDYRIVPRPGEVRYVHAEGGVTRDQKGFPLTFFGTVQDITDRKQAEEALRASEEKYRWIVETATEGIAMADANARMIFVNDRWSEIFGYSSEEAGHITLFDLVFPEDAARMKERWESRKRGQRERYEWRFRRKDGRPIWVLSSVAPRFGPEGEFLGTLVLNTDITERQRAEETLHELNATLESKVAQRTAELEQRARQLQKLTLELSEAEERERGRVAEILHDDLQQVLAAAKFHLSRVGSGTTSPAQSQEIVAQVRQMLKDAIEKSRNLSHELSPAVLRHGDLGETLDWLAEQMQAKHGLTVHVEVLGAVIVQSDIVKALVYRSAQELLFNVVKHARVQEARIRIRCLGCYVCLSVSDRGRGFDPQEVKQTTGFGLLSIRERVALLGGRTKVRSARGRGTTFHLIVPDAASAANGAPVAAETTERTATDPRL